MARTHSPSCRSCSFRRGAVLTVAALFSPFACRAAARPAGDVAREVPTTIAPPVPAGPTRFEYAAGTQRYRFTETTTLRATVDTDTTSRTVILRTGALVSVAVRVLGDSIELVTTVDSGGVPIGRDMINAVPPPGPTVDTIRAGMVAQPPAARVCAPDTTAARSPTFRFFIPVPETIDPSFVRRDTVVTVVCQGQVPVVARGARTSRVVPSPTAAAGLPTIRVETTYALEGTGVERQHNVRITGTGTVTSELVLDPPRGALARGTSDLRLAMTVRASGRDATVVQETRSRLELMR